MELDTIIWNEVTHNHKTQLTLFFLICGSYIQNLRYMCMSHYLLKKLIFTTGVNYKVLFLVKHRE